MWLPDLADPAWVREALARHGQQLGLSGVPTVELLDVRLTHPHRPGSPLCRGWATYRVTTGDNGAVDLYLKGFPDSATSQAAEQLDRAARPSGRCEHLSGEDVVVWRFPEDPTLHALPDLLAPRLTRADLPPAVSQALAPGSDALCTVVVRYQPEASATLRVTGGADVGGGSAFAKHLPVGTVAAVAARHRELWARTERGEPLRVAEPLSSDPVRGVLWSRGVAGEPLTAATPPDLLPDAAGTTGVLLAALHACGVGGTSTLTADGLLVELRKKAAKIVRAHPAAADRVGELVSAATRRRAAMGRERRCTLHGDFHLDQLVTSEAGPVLVDLDSMVTGPPEVDLAEFVVDLALRGLPGPIAGRVSHALLASYTAAARTRVDAAALRFCADAEFLNRCYRHLRRHARGWERDVDQDLGRYGEVERLLG